jgi:sporulation protein YqfC
MNLQSSFKIKASKGVKSMNKRKLDDILEMPKEVYSGEPKVTIMGFEELMVENYKGILEYEDYFVRINTHMGVINVNGFNLKMEKMTEDDIKITGTIESVDIERAIGG